LLASAPLTPKPAVVMGLALPSLASAKLPLAVPLSMTTSPAMGLMAAAPPKVAVVVPSYTLLLAVKPDTGKLAAVIVTVLLLPALGKPLLKL
jgi:hypothetical protein